MISAVLALSMEPHLRVNSKCYFVGESAFNIKVVWGGKEYKRFVSGFRDEYLQMNLGCLTGKCMERIFCTNSGVAGWYGTSMRGSIHLRANWLGHTTIYDKKIDIPQRPYGYHYPWYSEEQDSVTIMVTGDTLYYNTFASDGHQGPVLLNSLTFLPWSSQQDGSQLVKQGLVNYSVFGSAQPSSWWSFITPLYPSGPHTVTISPRMWHYEYDYIIDTVIDTLGKRTPGLAHYMSSNSPSTDSTGREVATFPGTTCRAFLPNRVRCAPLADGGHYTWETTPRKAMGLTFSPLTGIFALPDSLWLHTFLNVYEVPYTTLVDFAYAPVLAVTGHTLTAVETLTDASCPSGKRLFLTQRTLPSGTQKSAEPLNCEWVQVIFQERGRYARIEGQTVRWAGPWEDGVLFTAQAIQISEYYMRGSQSNWTGLASREHVVWGIARSIVRLYSGEDPLICQVWDDDRIPLDTAIVLASAKANLTDCVGLLVPTRVAPDTQYRGCPLMAHARDAVTIDVLYSVGVDPNLKCDNHSTPLIQTLGHFDIMDSLLDKGAALCTWPLNPFNSHADDNVFSYLAKMDAPCEPGWWLAPGVNCTGLTLCKAGNYCPGHLGRTNRALRCPAGTYGPRMLAVAVTQCRPCPPERPYSAPGASDISECVADSPAGAARDLPPYAPESPRLVSARCVNQAGPPKCEYTLTGAGGAHGWANLCRRNTRRCAASCLRNIVCVLFL